MTCLHYERHFGVLFVAFGQFLVARALSYGAVVAGQATVEFPFPEFLEKI